MEALKTSTYLPVFFEDSHFISVLRKDTTARQPPKTTTYDDTPFQSSIFNIHLVDLLCQNPIISPGNILALHSWPDLQGHVSGMQMKRSLRENFAKPLDKYRNNIQIQLLCQIESPSVKALDPASSRARPLREYHDRIALLDFQ